MEKHLDFSEFTNCLRIQIVPDEFAAERVEAVKNFCLSYGFKNVMAFITGEEFNLGHITREEAAPWIKTIKALKQAVNANGISLSLNPWIEMGHLDRGRKLKSGQNFRTMVDFNGRESTLCACPLDREWRSYFFDILTCFVQEIRPEVYWIEDDFRLHNHAPLEYGGCFCEQHINLFNQRLGTTYTREEFVKRAFAPGPVNPERQVWLDTSREVMRELAEKIGDRIHALDPGIKVGLMSSAPQSHCMEARDWEGIHRGLSGDDTKINRIHLPAYPEINAKEYYYAFNCVSMAVRRYLPDKVKIYPELENGDFSAYTKDPVFLRFQLESAIPLGISGMTYDIFDFSGNGPIEEFHYGEEVLSLKPYLQAVMDLALEPHMLRGVVVPIDERACYHRTIETNWQDLFPDEFQTAGWLSAMGVSYCYRTEKVFCGEIIALFNSSADNFTDSELEALFADNFVFIDGGAALKLKKRGLGKLAGITEARLMKAETGVYSYEQAEEGIVVNGIRGYRASTQFSENYVNIGYSEEVKILSRIYNPQREVVGNGFVLGKDIAVFPFIYKNRYLELFNDLRRYFLRTALEQAGGKTKRPFVITDYPGISPYLYKKEGGFILILVNATLQSFSEIRFDLRNVSFSSLELIDKKGGEKKRKPFTGGGGTISVVSDFDFMSTATLLLPENRL
jgi:hypothetical protein